MILGAKLLVLCEPAFCDELNLPKSTLTTATANYTAITTYTSPQTSANEYTVSLINGYPDCSLTRIVGNWISGLPFTGTTYSLDNLVVESRATATSVFKKISEGTSTGFGSYARPGSTTYGSTVVLATSVPYKVRTYSFQGFSFSGSNNQPAYVTNSYNTNTSCCSVTDFPDVNYFESATPGPFVPRTYPIAAIFATLRWIGVATAPVAGMNLTLRSPSGTNKAPWDIKVKGGSIIMKDRSGTTYSYSGTLAAARTAIQAAGFFTAAIPANIVSTGANPALVSDLQPFKATGIQSITPCVTALPIANMGDALMPSTVGSGYGNFSIGPGFTDDAAGLESFLTTSWYAKSGSFAGTAFAKYYISNEFDSLATNPQPFASGFGWEKTGGSSNHQEIFAAEVSPGNTESYEYSFSLVEAHCSLDNGQPCVIVPDPDFCNGNGSAYPVTPFLGSTCAGTPWPDDCNNGGLSGCWCERYDSVYVSPVQADQTVQQSLSGTFVIT